MMSKFKSGQRVQDISSGEWATVRDVSHNDEMIRVNWESGIAGKTWWKTSEFMPETNSPVRTETITRTVIEPGEFGRLHIDKRHNGDVSAAFTLNSKSHDRWHVLSASEWREVSRIATELAGALDAK